MMRINTTRMMKEKMRRPAHRRRVGPLSFSQLHSFVAMVMVVVCLGFETSERSEWRGV